MEKNKTEILAQIVALLSQLVESGDDKNNEPVAISAAAPGEMLTIKECAEAVTGLSEHTIRQLVAQEKIPYIRTGKGKRGKYLSARRRFWNIWESHHEQKYEHYMPTYF